MRRERWGVAGAGAAPAVPSGAAETVGDGGAAARAR